MRVEFLFAEDQFECEGVSPAFDTVREGDLTPHYDITDRWTPVLDSAGSKIGSVLEGFNLVSWS